MLSKLIKGMFNERPPVRSLIPSWNLESVLKKLNVTSFEQVCYYENSFSSSYYDGGME